MRMKFSVHTGAESRVASEPATEKGLARLELGKLNAQAAGAAFRRSAVGLLSRP